MATMTTKQLFVKLVLLFVRLVLMIQTALHATMVTFTEKTTAILTV